ncbi:hypothetical protein HPULCUR_006381 [Helicostylum pulchrum]|uniref:C2 domain-containing protein n=1 Tax=Helicostylum pulchrum TaxID=562976 RepID=A0ABP9Y1R7_9FUNG
MADTVNFNDPTQKGMPTQSRTQPMETQEAPSEEIERQKRNEREINKIQKKYQKDDDKQEEELMQKAPGNTLDASGHVHANPEHDPHEKTEPQGVLPDNSDPHAKVWSNDPNDNFADQWKPTALPTQDQVGADNTPNPQTQPEQLERRHSAKHHKHQPLGQQPLEFNRTFESTMSDLRDIFNTTEEGAGINDLHRSKLNNSTPLVPVKPDELIKGLQIKAIKYIVVACVLCYLVGRYKFGYIFGACLIVFCSWAYWNLGRVASRGLEWQLEKQENMKTLYTSEGESVEWLNFMIEKIWRSIDPDFFTVIEDLLEDTIQSVAPSFIKNVKVSDFDIGVQAPRIQMIRVFPPLPGQPEESIFGEASFSFHAHPVASLVTNRSAKSTPPGLAIRFQTALRAPLEVKAELTALSGKIRFKILTSPELPFISKATIAFTSVPKIETGVMPLSKHLNIMNLPTIKTLVNEGVKLGFADLVDPKSMTIDIKALMGAFNEDTNAIGVVKVEVRGATRDSSIKLQDMEDSYATLSLSTQPKKSSSSTRVLTNDKDPEWDENLYVLVYKDDIVSETKVDVKVWDADKVKFDDMWGSISISVKDIVEGKLDKLGNVASWCQDERVVFDGWTPIDGKDESQSKVRLNMKMSFHPKYPTPNMEIFSGDAIAQKANNKLDKEKLKKEHSELLELPVAPEHTNGIISVTIHQAVDLEIGDPEVLPMDDKFKHPYSTDKAVSPYAVLYINDRKVYQTRTKLRNPSPHWNAITEHFVADMENASLRFSIKTNVDLERDPVLGTKTLKLKEIFADQEDKFKEFQNWIPLANGIGFGKFLVTIKYKPVKMTLPRNLQGADVGTLVIERLSLTNLKPPYDDSYINSTKATLVLNLDPVILKRLKAKDISHQRTPEERRAQQEGTVAQVQEKTGPYGWYEQHLYFPLTMRYHTALYVHINQGSITSTKSSGRFWLKNMVDSEWQDVVVGLHPHINEKSKEANRNEHDWPEDGEFGQVTLRMKLVPGFSPVHTHLKSYNRDMIGADPFYNEALKLKAQRWIKEQNKNDEEHDQESPFDYNLQAAVEAEKSRMQYSDHEGSSSSRRHSNASSEYGEEDSDDIDDEMDDTEIEASMMDQTKNKKINKHRVVRKLSMGVDKVKSKVDVLREGFNSESRAGRTVAKEV